MVTEDPWIKDHSNHPTRSLALNLGAEPCRLSSTIGYFHGQIIRKDNGDAWKVEFRDGKPWAVRTPEHDTKAEQ